MTANDANKWAKEHASNTLANNLVYILNQIEDYAKRDHFDTSFSNIDVCLENIDELRNLGFVVVEENHFINISWSEVPDEQ